MDTPEKMDNLSKRLGLADPATNTGSSLSNDQDETDGIDGSGNQNQFTVQQPPQHGHEGTAPGTVSLQQGVSGEATAGNDEINFFEDIANPLGPSEVMHLLFEGHENETMIQQLFSPTIGDNTSFHELHHGNRNHQSTLKPNEMVTQQLLILIIGNIVSSHENHESALNPNETIAEQTFILNPNETISLYLCLLPYYPPAANPLHEIIMAPFFTSYYPKALNPNESAPDHESSPNPNETMNEQVFIPIIGNNISSDGDNNENENHESVPIILYEIVMYPCLLSYYPAAANPVHEIIMSLFFISYSPEAPNPNETMTEQLFIPIIGNNVSSDEDSSEDANHESEPNLLYHESDPNLLYEIIMYPAAANPVHEIFMDPFFIPYYPETPNSYESALNPNGTMTEQLFIPIIGNKVSSDEDSSEDENHESEPDLLYHESDPNLLYEIITYPAVANPVHEIVMDPFIISYYPETPYSYESAPNPNGTMAEQLFIPIIGDNVSSDEDSSEDENHESEPNLLYHESDPNLLYEIITYPAVANPVHEIVMDPFLISYYPEAPYSYESAPNPNGTMAEQLFIPIIGNNVSSDEDSSEDENHESEPHLLYKESDPNLLYEIITYPAAANPVHEIFMDPFFIPYYPEAPNSYESAPNPNGTRAEQLFIPIIGNNVSSDEDSSEDENHESEPNLLYQESDPNLLYEIITYPAAANPVHEIIMDPFLISYCPEAPNSYESMAEPLFIPIIDNNVSSDEENSEDENHESEPNILYHESDPKLLYEIFMYPAAANPVHEIVMDPFFISYYPEAPNSYESALNPIETMAEQLFIPIIGNNVSSDEDNSEDENHESEPNLLYEIIVYPAAANPVHEIIIYPFFISYYPAAPNPPHVIIYLLFGFIHPDSQPAN